MKARCARRVVVAVLAAALVGIPSAAAEGQPRTESALVTVGAEPDGSAVALDTTLYLPDATQPRPAVLLAHGFGGSKEDLRPRAEALQRRGFVVLAYTARGFGKSGGRIHLNDPAFEVTDARVLIDRLAADQRVSRVGTDPVVGVMGGSYGGALGLMLAGTDPRIDTVVSAITWHDLADAFFPQHASSDQPGPFKALWASRFFGGALGRDGSAPADGPGALCARFDPTVCRLFLAAAESGRPSPDLLTLLRAHSPKPLLGSVSAPTYLVQGMADTLFGLEHADATARSLLSSGTPVAVRWIDGGHDGPSSTADLDERAADTWLDEHLAADGPRGGLGSTPAFVYPAPLPRRATVAPLHVSTDYRAVGPPVSLPVTEQTQPVFNPPGGTPASVTAIPLPGAAGFAAYDLARLPGQSASWETAPVSDRLLVAGSPTLRLTVTSTGSSSTLYASLWQRTGGAKPMMARRLVAPVRITTTPGRPQPVEVRLPMATWTLDPGSSLVVLVTSTDSGYSGERTARADQVSVTGALSLPIHPSTPLAGADEADTESIRLALAIAAVLLVLAGLAWWRRRQSQGHPRRADLIDVPLVVEGLIKRFPDGHLAVNDVSWRAERGQVVGLLGPNGAGKTTTLRMVLGLIAPDGGTVHLGGEPVAPGAPALARVGALVEGPGFLPHLSGRANLLAYWEATGRPIEQARLDEALEVAALGDALERPVKSYSQGMRQRLGIAQAMLGQPDLLILDEPTNGLDPPQIAAMRPILTRYAAAGRTVVVSSHLLAEVEQTCSHVVVMHAGRVITTGRVADLVDSADTTVVELDPASTPSQVADVATRLRSQEGISAVEVVQDEGDPRLVVHATMTRPDVVQALAVVDARVVGISSRKHLEEVFLGVIASASGWSESDAGAGAAAQDSVTERLRQVRAR